MGSPVQKQVFLRVKQLYDDYCLADEEGSLDYKVPSSDLGVDTPKFSRIALKRY